MVNVSRFLDLLEPDVPVPLMAPAVFNALSARIAEQSGFSALYLGGGVLGYMNAGLEANLTLTEVADRGLEIRSASRLPLIMDGVCGWGDPMHVHRTVAVAEAAGFSAIELEDQWLPKRAHHHVRIEKMIPQKLMEQKISAAVAARQCADTLIIARTNAVRTSSPDDAIRRLLAYKRCGADLLFCMPRTPEEARHIAERLPPPLVYMFTTGGTESEAMTPAELFAMGYRLILVTNVIAAVVHRALVLTYAAIRSGTANDILGGRSVASEMECLNRSVGLEMLLDVERRTVGAR